MKNRSLPNLPRIGLGCENLNEDNHGIIKVALAAGITLFDTADCYGNNQSEKALGRALSSTPRANVAICSKVGVKLAEDGVQVQGDKRYIKEACYQSLERLQTGYLDLLYLHRIAPDTPIEQSMTALKELVQEGKVKGVGLSEATASQIRRAHKVHPLTAVQIEYAPWSRHDETNGVIKTCQELNIAIVAYSPLGRGFFTQLGKEFFTTLPEDDYRKQLPRYSGEKLDINLKERLKLLEFAQQKACTLPQLIIAWEMKQGIIPIPGTTNPTHLKENIGALGIELNERDIAELNTILNKSQYSGPRYPNKKISAIYPEITPTAHRSKSLPTLFTSNKKKPARKPSVNTLKRLSK